MKLLFRLTTLYYVGFLLLVVFILIATLSFNSIYTGRVYIFFIIALLLSSIGGFLFVYIYRKAIVEPLQQISSATRKIAEGQIEEVPVTMGTEIGMLAESFNLIVHTLRGKVRELENTVIREQEVARRLSILNELISSLIFKLELKDVLSIIALSSKTLIKSEFSAIAMIDRLTLNTTHFYSSLPDDSGSIKALIGNLAREIFDKNTSLRLSGSQELKELTGESLKIKNLLAIPIMIEGQTRGVLMLCNKVDADEFTQEDEDMFLMFALQSVMAIERAIFYEEILHLAKTDSLTGLNNHRTFYETLDIEIKRAERYDRPLCLLMIDIDDFKRFNDTYGHLSGDLALKKVAEVLIMNLRATDSAARYGGEEFTVILPETPLDAGVLIAERIRDKIQKHLLIYTDQKVPLTASIGVSVFPQDSVDKDGLIKAADDALLYLAKRIGKNMVVTFQEYKAAMFPSPSS